MTLLGIGLVSSMPSDKAKGKRGGKHTRLRNRGRFSSRDNPGTRRNPTPVGLAVGPNVGRRSVSPLPAASHSPPAVLIPTPNVSPVHLPDASPLFLPESMTSELWYHDYISSSDSDEQMDSSSSHSNELMELFPSSPHCTISGSDGSSSSSSSSNDTTTNNINTIAAAAVACPIQRGPGERQKYRHMISENSAPEIDKVWGRKSSVIMSERDFEKILANAVCSECHNRFEYGPVNSGAGAYSVLVCSGPSCRKKIDTQSPKLMVTVNEGKEDQKSHKICYNDFAATYMCQRNDTGYNGYVRLFSSLGFEPISRPTYYQHCKLVYAKHHVFYGSLMDMIKMKVRDFYTDILGVKPDTDGHVTLLVSADATFPKRGHTSNFGCTYIVEVYTGMAIDGLSRAKCRECADSSVRQLEDCSHPELHHGASGNMEGPLVAQLFKRSVESGFKYGVLVCDGDSKAYSHTKDTYGPNSVERELCGQHISKIHGYHLRKLRDTEFERVKTKTGPNRGKLRKSWIFKGKAGLTDETITKLGTYYQNIVKDTTLSVAAKRERILAILDHHSDHPDSPRSVRDHHGKCAPTCPWQIYWAQGGILPKRNGRLAKFTDNAHHWSMITRVYEHLARQDLLDQCTRGLTQSINESLHSKQHAMSDKCKFHEQPMLDFVMEVNMLQHNYGREKACLLHYLNIGMCDSLQMVLRAEDKDSLRVARRVPPEFVRRSDQAADEYGPGNHALG